MTTRVQEKVLSDAVNASCVSLILMIHINENILKHKQMCVQAKPVSRHLATGTDSKL